MDSGTFDSMKVNDLQEFLAKRGITTTNLRKKDLLQLCEAVKSLDLPVDPDFARQSTAVDLKQKLSSLPISDPFVDENFTNDFSEVPTNFTLFDIFNYLLHKTSDYDKKKLRAYKSCEDYRLFIDGHVESLTFNKCGDAEVCLFRAKVKPTQKDKTYCCTKFYQLWFAIKKSTGEVTSAYCTCIGGMDGACRHVSAALYELEAYEIKSVTDGENKWMKRPRSHDCPVPIKILKIVKANSGVFIVACLVDDFNECAQTVSGNRTPTAAQFREELGHFTPEVIKDIEHCTRGQAENPTWKAYRYGMLTASYFHRICKAVEKGSCPQSLLKSIMSKYDTDIHVPALEWGLKKEKVACDLYTRANRSVHKRVVVEKRGLYIMSDYPFIGCSVDGIFTCRCHGKKIIEIKCPYSLRHMHPREVAIQKGCVIIGNKSLVTEKSEYYHQMQGQMGIYGISCCDLVIYTEKGIHVSQLDFDEKFFSDIVMKMKEFFDKYLFQHLLADVTNTCMK
nr:uncharacterized protein LOC105329320 isoform X3 [Crassostrea gigas]